MAQFSIIIPAYKPQFLGKAIESVLSQHLKDWELIIVDDCSPYGLGELVKPYLSDTRIRYFVNDHNYGAEYLVDNWNHALSLCRGEYVLCMGDDDMLPVNSLCEYSRLFSLHPDVQVVHGQTEVIDENGEIIELLEPRFELESSLQMIYYRWVGIGRQQFVGDFCYHRKSLLEQGGFFNLPMAWGSDEITAVVAATPHGIVNSSKVCFHYRKNRFTISSGSNSRRKIESVFMQKQWYKQYLDSFVIKQSADESILNLVRQLYDSHFDFSVNFLLREDFTFHKANIFYWIRNKSRFSISFGRILIEWIKSFKQQ